MSLYLGNKKVCPVIGTRCAKGTVTSDSNGYVLLPKLDFTPRTIVLYRYVTYVNGADEPESDCIPYQAYAGAICTYIDVGETIHGDADGTWQSNWIAMVLYSQSGQFAMAGVSASTALDRGAIVECTSDGRYGLYTSINNSFTVHNNEDTFSDVTNVEFYYRAYA